MADDKSTVSWAGLRKTGAAPPLEASESAVAAPAADSRDATAKKRKSVRFNIPAKGTNPDYLGLAALGNKVVPDASHCRFRNKTIAHCLAALTYLEDGSDWCVRVM